MAIKTSIEDRGVFERRVPDSDPNTFAVNVPMEISGSLIMRQQYSSVGAGTYNVSSSDANVMLEVDPGGGSTTVVLPLDLERGFYCYLRQIGSGSVQVSGSSGVTLSSLVGSTPSLSAQWAHATMDKRSSVEWVVAGDIV